MILDGAMGTMIQRYGLTEADFRGERFRDVPGLMAGNNDLLSLTRPDVIRDIHRKYLAAGADIIETNTFSSQRVSMADYHVEEYCREINLAACRIARELAETFLYGILFLLLFLALLVLLWLAARGINLLLKLPVLSGMNALGGGDDRFKTE